MVEPKLSLTLVLPGSTMVSKQVASNKPEEFTKEEKVFVRNQKNKVECVKFNTRICNTARQVLKMTQEAYDAMLQEPSNAKYNKVVGKVKGKIIRVWDTMSEDARIRKHCEKIAHDFRAIDFDYQVLGE